MKTYNYSEVRHNCSTVFNAARQEDVIIARKDGRKFKLASLDKSQGKGESPLAHYRGNKSQHYYGRYSWGDTRRARKSWYGLLFCPQQCDTLPKVDSIFNPYMSEYYAQKKIKEKIIDAYYFGDDYIEETLKFFDITKESFNEDV